MKLISIRGWIILLVLVGICLFLTTYSYGEETRSGIEVEINTISPDAVEVLRQDLIEQYPDSTNLFLQSHILAIKINGAGEGLFCMNQLMIMTGHSPIESYLLLKNEFGIVIDTDCFPIVAGVEGYVFIRKDNKMGNMEYCIEVEGRGKCYSIAIQI